MVSTNGVADVRFLLIFLCNLGTIECVRQFTLLIRHLTYIVQQAGSLCLLGIKAKLSSHNSTEIGCFACVLQKVLTVRRTILHLTNNTYEFRMQSVYAKVDGCTLTCLDYFVVKLLLYFSHNFLDTCRMNTSVGYKLMQSQAANLTTYRVKG